VGIVPISVVFREKILGHRGAERRFWEDTARKIETQYTLKRKKQVRSETPLQGRTPGRGRTRADGGKELRLPLRSMLTKKRTPEKGVSKRGGLAAPIDPSSTPRKGLGREKVKGLLRERELTVRAGSRFFPSHSG